MALDQDWKDQFDYYYKTVNADNKESAKAQMDFQERMSSSSHQREVQDLIKAGLNPVLSANNGASSPAGAYANVDSSSVSAKFARQNLEKELENARTLQSMQNENSWNIAMQQLYNNKEIAEMNNKTSRFNTIVDKYGVWAGLMYGYAEDMFEDPGIQQQVNGLLGSKSLIEQAKEFVAWRTGQSNSIPIDNQFYQEYMSKQNDSGSGKKGYTFGSEQRYIEDKAWKVLNKSGLTAKKIVKAGKKAIKHNKDLRWSKIYNSSKKKSFSVPIINSYNK